MCGFKIGDRVSVYGIIDGNKFNGQVGTIICPLRHTFLVEFDDPINDGHDGVHRGRKGHCWFCHETNLSLYTEEDWEPCTEKELNNFINIKVRRV